MKKTLLVIIALVGLGSSIKEGRAQGGLTEAFDTRLFVTHSPIYPRYSAESVTFTAQGQCDSGVKKIRFWVKIYHVGLEDGAIDYGEHAPPIPRFDSDATGHSCVFSSPYPASATCSYPFDTAARRIPTNSYVWYRATMRCGDDSLVRDRKIRFAAKLTGGRREAYNSALPVYRRGIKDEKFNILFIPDIDYVGNGGNPAYIADVENFTFSGMFQPIHWKPYRRFFNIYMNDFTDADQRVDVENPDGNGCSDNTVYDVEPDNWDDLSWPDVGLMVHFNGFQDCSSIGCGNGRVSSSDAPNTTTHEVGHSLFCRGDEYSDGSGRVAGNHPNVFATSAECDDHASIWHASDYAASPGCRNAGTRTDGDPARFFIWCPAGDVMTDSGAGSSSTEEHAQILDQIGEWGLSAFSKQILLADENEEAKQDMEESLREDNEEIRAEQKDKTLLLRLTFDKDLIHLKEVKLIKGKGPHLFGAKTKSDYHITLSDNRGISLVQFWTQDPRNIAEEEDPKAGLSPPRLTMTHLFRVPWQEGMARLRIEDQNQKVVLDASITLTKEKEKPKLEIPPRKTTQPPLRPITPVRPRPPHTWR